MSYHTELAEARRILEPGLTRAEKSRFDHEAHSVVFWNDMSGGFSTSSTKSLA